jgi:hypothetical protein
VFQLDGSSRVLLKQKFADVAQRLPPNEVDTDALESLGQKEGGLEVAVQDVCKWLPLPTNKH